MTLLSLSQNTALAYTDVLPCKLISITLIYSQSIFSVAQNPTWSVLVTPLVRTYALSTVKMSSRFKIYFFKSETLVSIVSFSEVT